MDKYFYKNVIPVEVVDDAGYLVIATTPHRPTSRERERVESDIQRAFTDLGASPTRIGVVVFQSVVDSHGDLPACELRGSGKYVLLTRWVTPPYGSNTDSLDDLRGWITDGFSAAVGTPPDNIRVVVIEDAYFEVMVRYPEG